MLVSVEVSKDDDHTLGTADSLLHQLANREDLVTTASERTESSLLLAARLLPMSL